MFIIIEMLFLKNIYNDECRANMAVFKIYIYITEGAKKKMFTVFGTTIVNSR